MWDFYIIDERLLHSRAFPNKFQAILIKPPGNSVFYSLQKFLNLVFVMTFPRWSTNSVVLYQLAATSLPELKGVATIATEWVTATRSMEVWQSIWQKNLRSVQERRGAQAHL